MKQTQSFLAMDKKASVRTKSDGRMTDLSSRIARVFDEKKPLNPSMTTNVRQLKNSYQDDFQL